MIFSRLAEDMDIQLDTVVKRVDLVPGGGGVRVTDSQGKLYQADKVCVQTFCGIMTSLIMYMHVLSVK